MENITLLNEQKPIIVTKVALDAFTWAPACVHGPKHAYVGTFLCM